VEHWGLKLRRGNTWRRHSKQSNPPKANRTPIGGSKTDHQYPDPSISLAGSFLQAHRSCFRRICRLRGLRRARAIKRCPFPARTPRRRLPPSPSLRRDKLGGVGFRPTVTWGRCLFLFSRHPTFRKVCFCGCSQPFRECPK